MVGSLLRPAGLKQARQRYDEGKLSAEDLRQLEDQEIRNAVRLQEELGLAVVTDGEYRRLNFQDSFGESVSGYDGKSESQVLRTARGRLEPVAALGNSNSRRGERHGGFTKTTGCRTLAFSSKYAVGGVSLCQPRNKETRESDSHRAGSNLSEVRLAEFENGILNMDDFVADVVKIQREMIRGSVEAGCRYVQIDAPGYTAYVDPPSLQAMRDRGEDPEQNFSRSLKADNQVLEGFDNVTFGIHLCRGNQRSMWHREGTYDDIAERLLNELKHDRFLFEYDTPRAGVSSRCDFCHKAKSWCSVWSAPRCRSWKNRRPEAPHRCRQSIRAAGAVGRQPAVWFFIGRSREPDQRGRPKEKTRDRRRDRATSLGLVLGIAADDFA